MIYILSYETITTTTMKKFIKAHSLFYHMRKKSRLLFEDNLIHFMVSNNMKWLGEDMVR